jgi:hypothetical protein
MTKPFITYDIVYNYFHPQGINGLIGVFSSYNDSNDIDNAYITYPVTVNTTGSILHLSSATTNEYIGLFVNGNGYPLLYLSQHTIQDVNVGSNYIVVSSPSLTIKTNNPEKLTVRLIGTHTYPLCDISIYVDGIFWQSVSNNQQINLPFIPTKAKTYKFSLVLVQNGIKSYFSNGNCTLNVVIQNGETNQENGFNLNLPTPFGYFAGIFIVIAFTLSPLLIIGLVKKDFNLSSIPQFLYLIMGVVGFVVSVIIGFFPAWSIAVLIALAGLIITILYLQKKNTSSV